MDTLLRIPLNNLDLYQGQDGSLRIETCYEDFYLDPATVALVAQTLFKKHPMYQKFLDLTKVEIPLDGSPFDADEVKLLEIQKLLKDF